MMRFTSFLSKKWQSDVEHVAAVAEQGLVADVESGHVPIGRRGGGAGKEGGGQQLAERLQTVEETGTRRSADFYAVWR